MKLASAPAVEAGGARLFDAYLLSEIEIAGRAFDPTAPDKRFVVELWLDGWPARVARADLFDAELQAQGCGDGCYAYVFALDAETVGGAEVAEVRLANTGEPVGPPVLLSGAPTRSRGGAGSVRWTGGLRMEGWLPPESPAQGVCAWIDGAEVARGRASDFTHVGEAVAGGVARGFTLNLPLDCADGRLRRVRVTDDLNRELAGSPCPVIAFPRGLEQFLEARAELGGERLRAGVFDRLLPQSLPAAQYEAWAQAFPPAPPLNAPRGEIAVALIGEDGLEATLESLGLQAAGAGPVALLTASADLCGFAASDLAAFLDADARDCEFIVFSLCGVRFDRHALGRFSEALTRFPASMLAYCDIAMDDAQGKAWPIAFSAFDYERLLEQGYPCLCFAARVAHVRSALGKGASDLFRLFNCAFDENGPAGGQLAVHLPGFLVQLPKAPGAQAAQTLMRATSAHLETRKLSFGVEARASALFPAVRIRRVAPTAKVSILIPTRDRVDLLRRCLESLGRTLGRQACEIFVIDNDSSDPETLQYLDEVAARGVRIAHFSGPFNFARLVNAGASIAEGEYLLLLNNDVEATREGWLDEMLSRIGEPDVGAVGAQLMFAEGGVQHGGVVLGPQLAAAHAFDERMEGDAGYGELLRVAHETSAVTAACLLTPRRLFLQHNGFDGVKYPVLFNDVDYCLRLRAAGRRVVFTPHARLVHRASSSRGAEAPFTGRHRRQRDIDHLRMSWAEVLAEDPFYSPMLGLDAPYAGLAWPPRSEAPRLPRIPPPNEALPGF